MKTSTCALLAWEAERDLPCDVAYVADRMQHRANPPQTHGNF